MWKWCGCGLCCRRPECFEQNAESRRPIMKSNTFQDTVEPAEEVNMEADTAAIATEQPHAAPSPMQDRVPVQDRTGGCHATSKVTVAGVSESEVMDTGDLGLSTEDIPLIDLSTSSKESLSTDGQGQSENKEGHGQLISETSSTPNPSCKYEMNEEISSEDDVTDESEVSIGTVDTNGEKSKVTSDISVCAEVSDEVGHVTEDKVDRLAKLSEQIDDFDPSPIFNKQVVSEVVSNVNFTGDMDDDKLIDELINDSNVVTDNIGAENGKGAITPSEATKGDDDNDYSPSDDTDEGELHEDASAALSNVETADNIEAAQQNGDMSGSNESDGFQEDKGDRVSPIEVEKPTEVTNQNTVFENKQQIQKAEADSPTKKSKTKRKEDKSIEHILKALSSLHTTEEKLAALCKKYADLHEEHRVLQSSYKQNQRKLTVTSREKDQLQTEHTKAVMAKSKLESLCRELQKHNQTIRQESLQRAKEEDEKRKEISQKFQTTIGEIQTQMQENHERNKQLREENFELANKLKKFIEQYEAREQQVEKVIQHRELEQKLADAKLEQASAILMEEKGRSMKEKEMLILQVTEYMKKMQIKDAELNMYKERYEEFQSTIKKSEDMFTKFKVEMDKMTKRCKIMEKDGAQWKGKWENANRALLEMAEEKTKYDKERGLLMTKINKLESLCRAMQAERQARKLLETDKICVPSEMAKLGIATDDDPPIFPSLAMHTAPARTSPAPTNSNPTPASTEERVADSTTAGDDVEQVAADSAPSCEVDSDHSCASEQTVDTVIHQTMGDVDQSEDSSVANNQSESQIQEVTSSDQSGTNIQQDDEIPSGQSNTTS